MIQEIYNNRMEKLNKINEIKNREFKETWHNTKITDQLLPMPTHCLDNKKYNGKVYGALMTISNFNQESEKHRYLYENKFDSEILAEELGISKRTLDSNIKKLHKCGAKVLNIMNTQDGICYMLDYGTFNKAGTDINKYVTIPQCMLKELSISFDSNAIKLYCLFKYMCTENDFRVMTEEWICNMIGLNGSSGKNQTSVRTIIKTLEKCKYIETKTSYINFYEETKDRKIPKKQKSYRLCKLDEWKALDKKVD